MATILLPRTRSLHRRRGLPAWWVAIGAAIVVNLAIVLLLSQASRMQTPVPPPLAVISLRQVPPPVPPSPPAAAATPAATTPSAPLLSLDLPSVAPADPWALPAPRAPDLPTGMPLLMPAVTAAAAAPSIGSPSFDTPAQRLGAFDLDRLYPRTARARGISGQTRLRLHLDAHGEVTTWEVVDSTPPGIFEHAAAQVVRSLRYRPAQAAGQNVPSVVDELIAWTLP